MNFADSLKKAKARDNPAFYVIIIIITCSTDVR